MACGVRIVGKSEAAAAWIALAVGRRVEILPLQCCIRRECAESRSHAIATLQTSAEAFSRKARGEMIARKGVTVGGQPVLRVGKRGGDIRRTTMHSAVDTRLECIRSAGSQSLGQGPSGTRAGERKAHHQAGRDAII